MKRGRVSSCTILVLVLAFALSGCATAVYSKHKPSPPKKIDFGIIDEELKDIRPLMRKDIRITVGSFQEKTGQRKDSDRNRYSSAVTQGVTEVLYHLLYKAFGSGMVLERERENLDLIQREYAFYHKLDSQGRRSGLIQHNGPTGGLTGAQYLITGAVVYYHVDRSSGGGGLNIDGIGGNIQFSEARVGIQLRLIDMNTSEVCWSSMVESGVVGYSLGGDMFRFISTWGQELLVQAEIGYAQQLPADYAFQISLEEGVVRMIKNNTDIFLESQEEKKS